MKKITERLSITFTKPQIDFLRKEAGRLGISIGDALRRILDAHREGKNK